MRHDRKLAGSKHNLKDFRSGQPACLAPARHIRARRPPYAPLFALIMQTRTGLYSRDGCTPAGEREVET